MHRSQILSIVCGWLLGVVTLGANPVPLPAPFDVVMAGEDLSLVVGLKQTDLRGTFLFRDADRAAGPLEGPPTPIRVPVLVPVTGTGPDYTLAGRWKVRRFTKADVSPRRLLDIVQPKITVNGRAVPTSKLGARLILPSERHRSALARFLRPVGDNYSCAAIDDRFAIIELAFEIPARELAHEVRCEIAYRQFHVISANDYPEARYVPFFPRLPKGVNPATNPAYRIRVVAPPTNFVQFLSRQSTGGFLNASQLVAPRHGEAIAVHAEPRPKKNETLPSDYLPIGH